MQNVVLVTSEFPLQSTDFAQSGNFERPSQLSFTAVGLTPSVTNHKKMVLSYTPMANIKLCIYRVKCMPQESPWEFPRQVHIHNFSHIFVPKESMTFSGYPPANSTDLPMCQVSAQPCITIAQMTRSPTTQLSPNSETLPGSTVDGTENGPHTCPTDNFCPANVILWLQVVFRI